MDLLKAKIYLDKITREFARMGKDPDNIARIDVDIMKSYVREFYDAFLTEKAGPGFVTAPPKSSETAAAHKPVAAAPPAETPAPKPAEPPPPPPAPAPPPPVVVEDRPAPASPPPPPEAEPSRPHVAHPGRHPAPPEAEALFEQKQAKELSEKLSELPIADLRKAIALNDRLLFTRELFGGDNPAFEATLTALNGFSGMDQAKHYLLDNCVMRYQWTEKKHLETAKNFIKLVRRRYK